jgi:hypothetical protein
VSETYRITYDIENDCFDTNIYTDVLPISAGDHMAGEYYRWMAISPIGDSRLVYISNYDWLNVIFPIGSY